MERLEHVLKPLSAIHRLALGWFIQYANTEQAWPSPLDNGIFLASKAKGIFKPSWSEYALSVRQTLNSLYVDFDPIVRSDGTWIYQYHQEDEKDGKSNELYTNRALMACWRDNVPIGVMRQTAGKPNVKYKILGLALVAGWEDKYFYLEGFSTNGEAYPKGTQAQLDFILVNEAYDVYQSEFDPNSLSDARRRTMTSIIQRQGQSKFRETLLNAYKRQCAISRYDYAETLEAAHIIPYLGSDTNHIANGILLRSDFHTLFDLGKLTIDPETMTLITGPTLEKTDYSSYNGIELHLPEYIWQYPNREALLRHRLWTGL